MEDNNSFIDVFGLAKSYVRKNQVLTYNNFKKKSKVGDKLAGHELLQNSILKKKGLTKKRLDTDASKNNPVIALDDETHKIVNKAQIDQKTSEMNVVDNIETNAKILSDNGVPQTKVNAIKKQAIKHAKNLKIY